MDPNLKAVVLRVATFNLKRICRLIDKLQELFFPEERPTTSTNGMIGVNFPGKTVVVDLNDGGQSVFDRPVRKGTNTRHFGAGISEEEIPLHPSKRQKPSSTPSKTLGVHAGEQRKYEGQEIDIDQR